MVQHKEIVIITAKTFIRELLVAHPGTLVDDHQDNLYIKMPLATVQAFIASNSVRYEGFKAFEYDDGVTTVFVPED